MPTGTMRGRRCVAAGVALALVTVSVAAGWMFLAPTPSPLPNPGPDKANELKMPARLFVGWKKPELALLLSAEQHGYLLPCGCSRPQMGGLERRANLLRLLHKQGWPVASLDLGDVPQDAGPSWPGPGAQALTLPNLQGLIKYRYSMDALKAMDYVAVGLGEYETKLTLFKVLGEFAQNNSTPKVLSANLNGALFAEQGVNRFTVTPIKGSSLKLGVASVVGPSAAKRIKDGDVSFADNRKAIPAVLKEMLTQKPDVRVLLYHGSLKEARAVAGDFPSLNVILCLNEGSEPTAEPEKAGNTLIVRTGHKGRYVGVVGVYRAAGKNAALELKYQLVPLGEEFLTPESEADKHDIVRLMERYARELKDDDYLAKYKQSRHDMQIAIPGAVPSYVGSARCKKCHPSAYKVWEKSKHAHAYQTLVDAKQPGLRHLDAECIVCHTVGFGYHTGFTSAEKTPKLKDVGCESCHGPCSEHAKDESDERWYPLINPWRPKTGETAEDKKARMQRIDQFCYKCHDSDNDVNYKFEKRWPEVAHPTPGK